MSAYRFPISDSFASAIEWHGGRYLVSEILCRNLVEEESGELFIDFTNEADAWEFSEALEEEGPLSCGSGELSEFLYSMADAIV